MEFKDLLNNSRRSDLMDYIANARQNYEGYLAKEVKLVRKFKEQQKERFMKDIYTISEDKLKEARDKLFSGKVCGVDGNRVSFVTLPNVHCRIGIAGLSYKSDEKGVSNISYYFDETTVPLSDEQVDNPAEFLSEVDKKRKTESIDFYIGALMFFREREFALKERKEEWKIVHGPLVPIELIRYDEGYDLIKDLVEAKKIMGVISESRDTFAKIVGSILEPGQYYKGVSKHEKLFRHFNTPELEHRLKEKPWQRFFNGKIGEKIITGVYRTGVRSYSFEAHVDCFEEAMALIMADSMLQTEKGFPFLIDMADHYCATYFAASEFKQSLGNHLLNLGVEEYGQELSERAMREYK